MSGAPNNLPRRQHELGDEWVHGPNGEKFWGRFGAAGLLAWHRDAGVLLQLRAVWSHFGGTWGLPGGARKLDESAVDAAVREAAEEATVPRDGLRVIHESVHDLGFWSYTTVIVEATEFFEPVIADAESQELAWVGLDDVAGMPLHPGFAASWPALREHLV
ncbi:NUDIX domain-containing protein [Leifsonia sp. H3M29-4]|uniref:NUDIX domain-containing protein n=1 Tax=Salinibacterium metalliresistens TaxID=3031321 RepID=UPI0023DC29C4|nr:NUDIX domain-containing protein [Salinibacterium metalliresistens]MDF1479033.1 NUDIX domain-containing protein [Salinibacterium metalliresistens]